MNTKSTPVNPNATKEARDTLMFLAEHAGKSIITGQHTQTNELREIKEIEKITGSIPKLIGYEMLSYSPNINYDGMSEECLREVTEAGGILERAREMAHKYDVITAICFHWFSPMGGRDKSFFSENTDYDTSRILIEGTPEREAFYRDMDKVAEELAVFRDENIPVLWRPFHESEGKWFWWGRDGVDTARKLYLMMFDYFVNVKKLNNLLWVWSAPVKEGYPGDDYVDIVGWDLYTSEKVLTDYHEKYDKLVENTTGNRLAAITENGYLPDVDKLMESHTPWAFYMTWSVDFVMSEKFNTHEELKKMYDSDYAVKAKRL